MKECIDEEAIKVALDGSQTRFGFWLKAIIPDKLKTRFNPQGNRSSSNKARSSRTSHDIEGGGSISLKPRHLVPQKRETASPTTSMRKLTEEKQLETLQPVGGVGPPQTVDMWVEGLGCGTVGR